MRAERLRIRERRGEDMSFDLAMPILVVDDYATMARILRNLLKQIGFENVDDASDGSSALACRQEGGRQQLHRQAVQCSRAEDQDGSGVRRVSDGATVLLRPQIFTHD
jgi:CheY-like chemotaxis protein